MAWMLPATDNTRRTAPFLLTILLTATVGCGGETAPPAGTSGGPASDALRVAATPAAPADPQATGGATITGVAFVDSSVTSLGSRATLPRGAKVHPSGSTISGTEGCPTNRYGTDGLIVAVIDYTGRPTAGGLTITEHQANGMTQARAPYYLDLNDGRTLQFLGPIVRNGTYNLALEYDLAQGRPKAAQGQFTLARSCAAAQ